MGISRAVILAGGNGSRLAPATKVTNKHLLPIYDKPMIFYPLRTILKMGITEILIICGNEHVGDFARLLGSGKDFNADFTFRIQDGARGVADALLLAEKFSGGENLAVILGDNIFLEDFSKLSKKFSGGSQIFLKKTNNAHRFGVAEIKNEKIISIIEKPKNPKSDLAITGIYFFDASVFDKIKSCNFSKRGELEIVDVHKKFLAEKKLSFFEIFEKWTDAGTPESFFKASKIAREIVLSQKN